MNIIEASSSGFPIRRKDWQSWYTQSHDKGYRNQNGKPFYATIENLTAQDWEVDEPSVTITRKQFSKMWQELHKLPGLLSEERVAKVLGF